MQFITSVFEENIDHFLNISLPSQLKSDINSVISSYTIHTNERLFDKINRSAAFLDLHYAKIVFSNINSVENGKYVTLNAMNIFPNNFFKKLKFIYNKGGNIWMPKINCSEFNFVIDDNLLKNIIENTPNKLFVDEEELYWKFSDTSILSKITGGAPLISDQTNKNLVIENANEIFLVQIKSMKNFQFNKRYVKNMNLFLNNNIKIYDGTFDEISLEVLRNIENMILNLHPCKDVNHHNALAYKEYEIYKPMPEVPKIQSSEESEHNPPRQMGRSKSGRRRVVSIQSKPKTSPPAKPISSVPVKPKINVQKKIVRKPIQKPKRVISKNVRFK